MLKRFLIGAAVLLGCGAFSLQAQTGARIEPSPVMTSLTTPGVLSTQQATVTLCNHPANAVPCTNKATTYTDATLGTPCSASTQIVLDGTTTCVAQTDTLGNFGFWVVPGYYDITITLPSGQSLGAFYITASYPVNIASPLTFTGPITITNGLTVGGATALNGGGSLTGTFTGTPTFSGNVVFSANPNFTGNPTFSVITNGRCLQGGPSGTITVAAAACGTSSGTITATGAPAAGNLGVWSGATSMTNGDLSGDATTSGTTAVTVIKVNGNSAPSAIAQDQIYDGSGANTFSKVTIANCPNGLAYTQGAPGSFSCTAITQFLACSATAGAGTITKSPAKSVASCSAAIPATGTTFRIRAEAQVFATTTGSPNGMDCWFSDGSNLWGGITHIESSANNNSEFPMTWSATSLVTYNPGIGSKTVTVFCQQNQNNNNTLTLTGQSVGPLSASAIQVYVVSSN